MQYSGIGFVTLAVAGLVAQLVLVQRLRPTARQMLRAGVPLALAAFVVFAVAHSYPRTWRHSCCSASVSG